VAFWILDGGRFRAVARLYDRGFGIERLGNCDRKLETTMQPALFLPSPDTLLLTLPFFAILGLAMLGLDERVATPRHEKRAHRGFCGVDWKGRPVLSDPDGKPFHSSGVRQIEAKLDGPLQSN
jgi:hypothetical protein